jgi:exopolyphosphatase/guanosine-5'-triphosphate,3'-diphosphate pyrophosphatase
MHAAIDVGSNTIRLVIGQVCHDAVMPIRYVRHVTRLAGNFHPRRGLSRNSMNNALAALQDLAAIIEKAEVEKVRVVGTEALRRAPNADEFIALVNEHTGLRLHIIDGMEEARLSCAGMYAALDPTPERCLMFDIGGGSTEFILCEKEKVLFQKSYPLGVVELCEKHPQESQQHKRIFSTLDAVAEDMKQAGTLDTALHLKTVLVGTAGTVTTLAAMKMEMTVYDGLLVNNQVLNESELRILSQRLAPLSSDQREELPGVEKGRGDLIIPGLRIVLGILKHFDKKNMKVSDFGLLEGLLLDMAANS